MTPNIPHQQGFLTVEIILAVLTIGIIALAIGGLFAGGQDATVLAGKRNQALFLAEEGLEATRSIRDHSFFDLATGTTHGLDRVGSQWYFSGTEDITDDTYTRTVEITEDGENARDVKITITWPQNSLSTGTIITTTRFTNWQQEIIP